MDIITQLQDQVNQIASIAFNTVGSLQRDAPPARLLNSYPDPAAAPPGGAPGAPGAAAAPGAAPQQKPQDHAALASDLVKAAKQFDALVAALPVAESGEDAQLKRIAELQEENEIVGRELRLELEAAEEELKQVRELFHTAADDCLHFKPMVQ